MAASIHTIHVNSATKTSLNDRFTALSSQPKASVLPLLKSSRRRSRSRDLRPEIRDENEIVSIGSATNRRLLQQLAKKHKMMTALKLKRRSMKPGASMAYRRATKGMKLKRGSVKAFRLAPSGSPIKANSLTKVATMKADLLSRMPTRRSNSITNLSARLGMTRSGNGVVGGVGGAAGRVAKRRLARVDARSAQRSASVTRRQSRSRSRARLTATATHVANTQNANFYQNKRQERQQSRQRVASRGRSRSRSRSRAGVRQPPKTTKKMPITSRLGVKQGASTATQSSNNVGRGRRRGNLNRIQQGRIQKQNNSTRVINKFRENKSTRVAANAAATGLRSGNLNRRLFRSGTQRKNSVEINNNRSRGRSNSVARGGGRRSRSRSRNNQNNRAASIQRKQQQQKQQTIRRGNGAGRPRGRGQQRGRGREVATGTQRSGNGQQQERRGRSRSRGRGRQLGKTSNIELKREDLDKELDQYMATTKTETGMDFLLRK